ncbi:restriction endonuclease subunit S [Marinospirillum sp.]|uniref:restriction endonuclease subunit S n=1 Tax=Marinospirillum sp. TaxID=2183934 RepID=UPI00384B3654
MSEFIKAPKEWKRVVVGAIAQVIDPHPSHRAPIEDPQGIPFAGIGDLDEFGNVRENKVRKVPSEIFDEHIQRYQITDNTIGFGRVASIGKIIDFKRFNRKVTISPTIAIVEPNGKVDKKFLVHCLRSQPTQAQINFFLTGSTRSSLGIALLRDLLVPEPPLPEQNKIAAILSSVDEVIEKTRTQIDKLKDLKTGMMQELLTKGIGPGGVPHTEFKDSPVGRIPAGWSIQEISKVCSHIVDCVNKTAPVVNYATPYRMIRTTNVRDGRVKTENLRYVTSKTFDLWTRRLKLEKGDLIFTREAPVGECGLLENAEGLFLGQRTMVYRVDQSKMLNQFLLYSLQSEYCQLQLSDLSGGSTTPHLRVPDCSKIILKVLRWSNGFVQPS